MSKYLELVEGSFTAEHEQRAQEWPYVAYSVQDGKCLFSIVPSEDGEKWIVTAIRLKDISNLTYNAVDLGLPSGLKWADRNVGASSPEDFGSYFQWGDTNAYTYEESSEITTEQLVDILNPLLGGGVTVDNIKDVLDQVGVTGNDLRDVMKAQGLDAVSMNKEFNWYSYFDTTDGGSTFKKYNHSENGLKVLESGDDAATVYMGSQYRMPTSAEIEELIFGTTQTFIDLDGNEYDKQYVYDNELIESGKLKGVRFTSSNGNSIFIPAAGGCYESLFSEVGVFGILWSSSLGGGNGASARYLYFNYDGSVNESGSSRCYGQSVRGVTL